MRFQRKSPGFPGLFCLPAHWSEPLGQHQIRAIAFHIRPTQKTHAQQCGVETILQHRRIDLIDSDIADRERIQRDPKCSGGAIRRLQNSSLAFLIIDARRLRERGRERDSGGTGIDQETRGLAIDLTENPMMPLSVCSDRKHRARLAGRRDKMLP